MITTLISASVLAGVAWAGKAFVRWIEVRNERLEKRDAIERCPLPPKGWECARKRGHDGPCAAFPSARNGKGKPK